MFSRRSEGFSFSCRSSRSRSRQVDGADSEGSRKGISLNEREVAARKRGTITETSLRLSSGLTGFGFLWARFLVFRVILGCLPVSSICKLASSTGSLLQAVQYSKLATCSNSCSSTVSSEACPLQAKQHFKLSTFCSCRSESKGRSTSKCKSRSRSRSRSKGESRSKS